MRPGDKFRLPASGAWLLYHSLDDLRTKPPVLGAFVDPASSGGVYEVVEVSAEFDAAKLKLVEHGSKDEVVEGAVMIGAGPYKGGIAATEGWTDGPDLRVYGKRA